MSRTHLTDRSLRSKRFRKQRKIAKQELGARGGDGGVLCLFLVQPHFSRAFGQNIENPFLGLFLFAQVF